MAKNDKGEPIAGHVERTEDEVDARMRMNSMALDEKEYELIDESGRREVEYRKGGLGNLTEAVVALANEDPGAARMALFGTSEVTYGRLPGDPANPVPVPDEVKKAGEDRANLLEEQAERQAELEEKRLEHTRSMTVGGENKTSKSKSEPAKK